MLKVIWQFFAIVAVTASFQSVANATTQYYSPFILNTEQAIQLGNLKLKLQGDGNLVLSMPTGNNIIPILVLWNSGTPGRNCYATPCQMNFQGDGNLVLYQNGQPYFNTGTVSWGSRLRMSDQMPYMSIIDNTSSVLWSAGADFTAGSNLRINSGKSMLVNGMKLSMQTDGNLVLYRNGVPLWSSGTGGRVQCAVNECSFIYQADGNMVLYKGSVPYAATGTMTQTYTSYWLSIQSSGYYMKLTTITPVMANYSTLKFQNL